ncbi:MAG: helix-turn-helix domain-containing protein [Roseburia sp.]
MPEYKKIGYLTSSFKMFHLKDTAHREFHYHYHDFHKILILLSGDVTYCIEGRTYDLKPDDIVLVNAGEVHRPIIRSTPPYERIIIYVSPEFLTEYQDDDNDLGLCLKRALAGQSHVLRLHSSRSGKLGASIRELDKSLTDKDYASALFHRVLFLEFMIQLNRSALHNHITFIGDSASNEKILAILSYLNDHLTEDVSIDNLSARFFLSRYYLMHTFKQQTGYTIGGYILAKRLFLARELIAEGKPITDICYACGFKNYSTFSRAYKKSFGESPRDYRQSLI